MTFSIVNVDNPGQSALTHVSGSVPEFVRGLDVYSTYVILGIKMNLM